MNIKEIINFSKKDKTETILKNLNKKGFYKFNSKLNKKIIDKTLEILDKESNNNKQEKETLFHKDAVNISNLHLKNNFFYNFVFNKFFLKVSEKFFRIGAHKFDKNIFQLDMINARILKNFSKEQLLHIDSRICGVYPPTQIQFLFYLNNVDKKNYGATQVVPGSHKINRFPQKKDRNKVKQILGKAGDFFAIDSSLWHGSSVKKNNTQRTLVTLSYSRWNIRQSYAIPYGINKYKPDNFNQKQKYLLGYFNYPEKTEKERARMRGSLPKL
mgnify:FL=1|jgi:ectoine hydroxylase-related dioxygenase (phytanoyl-CoA dioxygenase family)